MQNTYYDNEKGEQEKKYNQSSSTIDVELAHNTAQEVLKNDKDTRDKIAYDNYPDLSVADLTSPPSSRLKLKKGTIVYRRAPESFEVAFNKGLIPGHKSKPDVSRGLYRHATDVDRLFGYDNISPFISTTLDLDIAMDENSDFAYDRDFVYAIYAEPDKSFLTKDIFLFLDYHGESEISIVGKIPASHIMQGLDLSASEASLWKSNPNFDWSLLKEE